MAMIEGVVVKPLKQFTDERGKLMHMLKASDELFEKFGEIYFSVCNPGFVKAWKMHKKKVSFYCVLDGIAKIVLCDMRKESSTFGHIEEIVAGEDNYIIIRIPAGVAHGFTPKNNKQILLANLTTEPYDPSDNFDIDYKTDEIKYKW